MQFLGHRNTPLWLGLLLPVSAVAFGFALGGDAAEQAKLAARWTARAALPLFLVTYLASTLFRRWPGEKATAIMRYRRQWGLGFALAHSIHLAALGVNVVVFAPRPWSSLIPGALAYAILYVMALTSTNGWQRRLGAWWKHLHAVGIHYLWFIFTASYALRAFGDDQEKVAEGWILGSTLIGALALRLWVRGPGKSPRAP